jgi:hypothetical protein
MMSKSTFTAGRDIKGVFATGNHAKASGNLSDSVASEPNVDIAAALAAVHDVLVRLHGIEPKAITRVEEAREEVAKAVPQKEEVASLVEQATRYARQASGFAEAAGELVPQLQRIGSWLGFEWQNWSSSLGIG